MKYKKKILCILLLGSLFLNGCGNSQNHLESDPTAPKTGTFVTVDIETHADGTGRLAADNDQALSDQREMRLRSLGQGKPLPVKDVIDNDGTVFKMQVLPLPTEQYGFASSAGDVAFLDEEHALLTFGDANRGYTLVSISLTNNEVTEIASVPTGEIFNDICATPNYIYWQESDLWLADQRESWKVVQYSKATGERRVVLSYEDVKTDIVPRTVAYGDDLLFITAEGKTHTMVRYEADTEQVVPLFRLNHFQNPYLIPAVRDDCVYIPDYKNGNCLLRYDLQAETLSTLLLPTEYETDTIYNMSYHGDKIAYVTAFSTVYLYDCATDSVSILKVPGTLPCYIDGHLLFSSDNELYYYNEATDKCELLKKNGWEDYAIRRFTVINDRLAAVVKRSADQDAKLVFVEVAK